MNFVQLKMILSTLFVSLALAQVPIYGDCNKDNFKLKPLIGKSFPLVPSLSGGPIVIKGNIFLIDGCNFGVKDFVFYNARQSVFYGGNKGTADGIVLSDTPVTQSSNPAVFNYTLVTRPGAQANLDSINEIRLFEQETKILLAVASLPAPTGNNGGSNTSVANSRLTTENSFGIISAILLAFFL